MLTRRGFLGGAVSVMAACAAPGSGYLPAAGKAAWPAPIGLELYTVRDLFAKDPAGTLQQVAAVGYKEVEIGPGNDSASIVSALQASGLTAPSTYVNGPKTIDDFKSTLEKVRDYGVHYIVVGDNPRLDVDAWNRRADLYNQCGTIAHGAGLQFCYHAHFNEFARLGDTCGYDIMLTRCDPKLLKMEMDIFWLTYAGVDPLHYFKSYPGRFPLLHIKDMYRDVAVNPHEKPPAQPNPFAPVGQGKIDWPTIFAHTSQAGAKHIFVEQDYCNMPPLEAIKISFNYIRNLQLV